MVKDHQHLMLMREAVDLSDRFPDLPDHEVIGHCLYVVSHPHAFTKHPVDMCPLCKSIIIAYDKGYEAGEKHLNMYYD